MLSSEIAHAQTAEQRENVPMELLCIALMRDGREMPGDSRKPPGRIG
jgi:hypothetical protein